MSAIDQEGGDGAGRLGQQICQGLSMCLAVYRTDADLAGPWGKRGAAGQAWSGTRSMDVEKHTLPPPACSAQPTLRAGGPDTALTQSQWAEQRPGPHRAAPQATGAQPPTPTQQGPQDILGVVSLLGRGTPAPGQIGTGL